ncbi:MAG: AraC family transcriptional regulator, partial [Acetatifactor sp.]|nr:AraC family transcriptional regulator [Acetatifactor sp.]
MKILRAGCASKHISSFYMNRAYGQDNHVLLLLRSNARLCINEKNYSLNPGSAILISPNTGYNYYDPDGKFSDDWIHFRLESTEKIPASLQCNIPFQIDDIETCSTLIRQLLWEDAYTSLEYAEANINALFTVLLNHLAAASNSQERIEKASPYLWSLKQIRLNMQTDVAKDHSISKYSEELCISPSHFKHLYSQLFGTTFQSDLIHMRIARAELLLQTTSIPIDLVAESCG